MIWARRLLAVGVVVAAVVGSFLLVDALVLDGDAADGTSVSAEGLPARTGPPTTVTGVDGGDDDASADDAVPTTEPAPPPVTTAPPVTGAPTEEGLATAVPVGLVRGEVSERQILDVFALGATTLSSRASELEAGEDGAAAALGADLDALSAAATLYSTMYGGMAVDTAAELVAIDDAAVGLRARLAPVIDGGEDTGAAVADTRALAEQVDTWLRESEARREQRIADVLATDPQWRPTSRFRAVNSFEEFVDAVEAALRDDALTLRELGDVTTWYAISREALILHGTRFERLATEVEGFTELVASGELPLAKARFGDLAAQSPRATES